MHNKRGSPVLPLLLYPAAMKEVAMLDRRIRRLQTLLIAVVLTVTVTGAVAGDFSNGPSLQGFTGIMNVPTANVQKEGTMAFWYGKQKDGTQAQYGDNYFFSTGMFSLLEIGGRVAVGNSAGANDLSAQFKVTTAPFTPKDRPWFPTLAVGAQDVGGQASHYNTTYLVATEEISRFRLSLGYGFGSNQTGRLKGLFAGGEIKAFDWLYLLGEYDAKDTNLGLRVISPDLFGYPVNLQSMIKSAVSNNPGTIDFTLGFQFAMGRDWHRKPTAEQHSIIPTVHPEDAASQSPLSAITTTAALPIPATGTKVSEKVASKEDDNLPVRAGAEIVARASVETTPTGRETLPVKAGAEVTPAGVVAVALSKDGALRGLRDRLVADGFMNVRVGTKDHELIVVEYENARYNQSQLDGLGVVLGMVSDTVATDYQTVRLVLKIQGLKMLQLSMPSAPLRTFLRDAAFNDSLGDLVEISSTVTEERDVAFLEEASFANWFRSRLVLAPRLTTFLATEISSLDYLLAFAPTLTVDLWKGALLNITGTIPVVWSKGFDDDYPFRASRNDPQVETVMLNQALRIHPDFMISLGAGMIQHDVYGTLNEAYWYSKGGEHRLGFQQGVEVG